MPILAGLSQTSLVNGNGVYSICSAFSSPLSPRTLHCTRQLTYHASSALISTALTATAASISLTSFIISSTTSFSSCSVVLGCKSNGLFERAQLCSFLLKKDAVDNLREQPLFCWLLFALAYKTGLLPHVI